MLFNVTIVLIPCVISCLAGGDTSVHSIVGGGFIDTPPLFILTFTSSILSASFGLAKTLKLGVCRTMARAEGPLGGLLTGRFILLVTACAGVLLLKGVMISICGGAAVLLSGRGDSVLLRTVAGLALFLPQTVLALCTTIGCGKSSVKMLIRHPSLILLPTFTFFTFAKISPVSGERDVRVRFSRGATWCNLLLSCLYMGLMTCCQVALPQPRGAALELAVLYIVTPIGCLFVASVVPTTIFLLYDKLCCCCCSCCLQPTEELVVFDPEWPDKEMTATNMI